MRRLLLLQLVLALAVFAAGVRPSQAEPLLQLDIEGGVYDNSTETLVATGPVFTLYALLTPDEGDTIDDLLNDFYYISAALTPKTGESGGEFGSFTFDGATDADGNDLGGGVEAVDEDLNGNGVLDTNLSEDFNNNGILDLHFSEDLDNDGILDAGEDFNNNGVLDSDLSEDLNQNGMLDTDFSEDLNGDGFFYLIENPPQYDVTGDMLYGSPPIDACELDPISCGGDPGDIGGHGIFDTYFIEFEFQFDPSNTTATYDTETDGGGSLGGLTAGTGSYLVAFQVDLSGLDFGYTIHFDLYSTELSKKSNPDVDIKRFAPFSHDAEGFIIPEPTSLLLLGSGLLGLGTYFRRRRA